jgi:tetratricopeptide (TPR) repeat protein
MKKYLFIVMFLFSFSSFAQDATEGLSEGLKAKNDGNEAYRNKNYVEAIKLWDKYLSSGEEGIATDENTKSLYNNSYKYAANEFLKTKDYQSALTYLEKFLTLGGEEAAKDGSIFFNIALASSKLDKNDVALSNFQKSIDLGYKPDVCTIYIANIYKDAGNDAKMEEILKAAIVKYADSNNLPKMLKMLTVPLLKDASVPFNAANELAKKASTGTPEEYMKNMELASTKFQEAIPIFENVLKYDSTNEQATTYLKACKDNIAAFNEYKVSIKK